MSDTALTGGEITISCDQALKIAQTDAESVYREPVHLPHQHFARRKRLGH